MADTNEVCHYLEAAPADMPTELMWGSRDINISGTETGIGTGRKNTALILAAYANSEAAKSCNDYRGPNNLTDWFLPSKDELNQLYINRSSVGNMVVTKTGSAAPAYWSSSQGNLDCAWRLFSNNGEQDRYGEKGKGHFVRPIRAY
jgi:hypothetical protein